MGGGSILQLPHGTVLITVGPNFPCRAGCPEEELAGETPRVSRGWGFPLRAELKTQSWISTQLEPFGLHHETRLKKKSVSFIDHLLCSRSFPGDSGVKNPPAMQERWVQSLAQEDPLEEGMATLSSVIAWEIPWTEEPGGLQSLGLQRVGHDLATKQQQLCSRHQSSCLCISSLSVWILLRGCSSYCHFIDEETKAQRGYVVVQEPLVHKW